MLAIDAADLLDEAATERAMEGVVRRASPDLGIIVIDAAELFGDGIRAALDGSWILARAAATTAMIEAEAGGKIVLIAPGPEPVSMRRPRAPASRTSRARCRRSGRATRSARR